MPYYTGHLSNIKYWRCIHPLKPESLLGSPFSILYTRSMRLASCSSVLPCQDEKRRGHWQSQYLLRPISLRSHRPSASRPPRHRSGANAKCDSPPTIIPPRGRLANLRRAHQLPKLRICKSPEPALQFCMELATRSPTAAMLFPNVPTLDYGKPRFGDAAPSPVTSQYHAACHPSTQHQGWILNRPYALSAGLHPASPSVRVTPTSY